MFLEFSVIFEDIVDIASILLWKKYLYNAVVLKFLKLGLF